MNTLSLENGIASSDNRSASDDRKQTPLAFLDLADLRVELKRLEHERQRLLQRKFFEDQMRELEVQQAQELPSIPYAPCVNGNNFAVSAPTTPPDVNAVLNGDTSHQCWQLPLDAESLWQAVGSAVADKHKSVAYAPSVNLSPNLATTTNGFTGTREMEGGDATRVCGKATGVNGGDGLRGRLRNWIRESSQWKREQEFLHDRPLWGSA
ncbi:hypothetical protein PTI98_000003 [Pleurotus ostreatus]|nr:hypothetical protein PTI98_000003 [Pleurotus ostreatus]